MDMKVTLGNVIEIAVILGGIFLSHVKQRERMVAIETMLGPLWTWWNARQGADRAATMGRK